MLRQTGLKRGAQLWIDLGDVKNLEEVIVNGKSLGTVWKKPFRIDVTGALKPGKNNPGNKRSICHPCQTGLEQ